MDSLRLRAGGFCCFVIVRPLSPCILPVCFAAFAFANILLFTYQKKQRPIIIMTSNHALTEQHGTLISQQDLYGG